MIKTVALIGAGQRGTALAQCIITKGIDLVFYDVNETLLRRSIELIKNNLRQLVQQRALTAEEMSSALGHIKTKTSLQDTGNCDIIIETVPDDIKIKRDLFKHLDNHAKKSALLVTTTSLYTVSSLAIYVKNSERMLGFHFPGSIEESRCVELIPTLCTNSHFVSTAYSFLQLLGKQPILSNDSPGFIVERALQCWYREALQIVEEAVAQPEQVDRIVTTNLTLPEGPFQQMDKRGLDVIHHACVLLHQQRFFDPRFQPSKLLQQMVDLGLHGKKTNRGFYTYQEER